jgi:hypothetical protein
MLVVGLVATEMAVSCTVGWPLRRALAEYNKQRFEPPLGGRFKFGWAVKMRCLVLWAVLLLCGFSVVDFMDTPVLIYIQLFLASGSSYIFCC